MLYFTIYYKPKINTFDQNRIINKDTFFYDDDFYF